MQQIEPLALYLLDAKRDIAEDLRTRSSFWSKMVSEHGLTPEDVTRIEDDLSQINREIVESSEIFSHIETHLKDFHVTLSCDEESIAIAPLARHLRDLSRGMDVVLSTRGAPPFSLNQQGMGTWSLGTFFTFWAFATWRQKQAESDAVHPMMALEEPETHLHPQAQRALFRQIKKMPGQRIVSTHSPYICGQAEIAHIRHFSKMGEQTIVSRIAPDTELDAEALRKIDRQVMNTRGDMLFAQTLVFFEGETEATLNKRSMSGMVPIQNTSIYLRKTLEQKKITLTDNFRSSKKVVAAAQRLDPSYCVEGQLPVMGTVEVMEFDDEADEAQGVVSKLKALVSEGHPDTEGDITLGRCAVLGRNRFVFKALEEKLKDEGLSFYKKFAAAAYQSESDVFEEFELALRILANPKDRLHLGILAKAWKVALEEIDRIEETLGSAPLKII